MKCFAARLHNALLAVLFFLLPVEAFSQAQSNTFAVNCTTNGSLFAVINGIYTPLSGGGTNIGITNLTTTLPISGGPISGSGNIAFLGSSPFNASGATNLNASNLTTGTIPLSVLPIIPLTNLSTNGAASTYVIGYNGSIVTWVPPSMSTNGGTVTSIGTSSPLTGGPITMSGTIGYDGTLPHNESGATNINPTNSLITTGGTTYQSLSVGAGNVPFWQFNGAGYTNVPDTSGTVSLSIASPSVNYVDGALTGNLTINLPAASTCKGKVFTFVRNVGSGSFNVIPTAFTGDKFLTSQGNFSSSVSFSGTGATGPQIATYMSDGNTNWIASQFPVQPVGAGGTGAALTSISPGSVIYGSSSSSMGSSSVGSSNQILMSRGSLSPTWTGQPVVSAASLTTQTMPLNVLVPTGATTNSVVGFDGTNAAWVINSSSGPVQNGFSARLTADMTGVGTSPTLVTFNTTTYNVGSYFNTTSNRYTPPAGIVNLGAAIHYTGTLTVGNNYGVAIYKNGVQLVQQYIEAVTVNGQMASVSCQDNANGTDYYQVYALSGNASQTIDSTTNFTYFYGSQH